MKKDKKGSALIWTVVVIMVLSIAIAGAMAISYTNYNRSIQNNSKRQAYLTSKNIIEDFVNHLSQNDAQYLALFKDLSEGETTSLTFSLPENNTVGIVEGDIKMLPKEDTKGKLTLRITATYGEQNYTTYADLQLGKKDQVNTWQLLRYYKNADEK